MAERGLTAEEWDAKEVQYQAMLDEIIIPAEINAVIIKDLISKIDRVLSAAYPDFTRTKNAYERVQRENKVLLKEMFLRAKQGQVPDLGERVSDEVAKAWAEVALKSASDPSPIWVENECARRFNFMQAVISILSDKRQMLITDQGVLKLEANVQQ